MTTSISSNFAFSSHFATVEGSKMHYIEQGSGYPILFLHPIPASAYIWRNVIPHLATLGRCVAPDLIGFGKSDKPDIAYTVFDHIRYIDKLIETLNLKDIILVMHGWGSLIGFDYAMRHPENCKGLVFYESYLKPMSEEDCLPLQEQMYLLEKQEKAIDIVKQPVSFVDEILTQGMMRSLTPEELNYYREPFLQAGTGKPLHQFLQELPCGKKDSKVEQLIKENLKKLKVSPLPKLMLYSIPGFITSISTVMWAKENIPNLEVAEIGEALHYAQENDPTTMGETISIWLQGIEQTL